MIRFIYFLIVLLCFSCNNERVLQLPEIENAQVTEVLDVSPAYIFYDETQPDSTLLNRKNLIITTNWLVNVDKRLTLRQAIPRIKFLQDKKRNAEMHKNENAKNYFSCNDTSIQNLGFIEFTDTYYNYKNQEVPNDETSIVMMVENLSNITFSTSFDLNIVLSKENISHVLEIIRKNYKNDTTLTLSINENLTFQEYITLKNTLAPFHDRISNNEFIY
ncbi:hypothetical protein [uncultured Winogradskyella sp.]|uniref:hypothetical protein n=1 Tax=uncultured Winogradskyella sp. TaxID=395353 RepID=UPI0026075EC9|nr:hypothetical protein [uncultured Winogradskyella sp.]